MAHPVVERLAKRFLRVLLLKTNKKENNPSWFLVWLRNNHFQLWASSHWSNTYDHLWILTCHKHGCLQEWHWWSRRASCLRRLSLRSATEVTNQADVKPWGGRTQFILYVLIWSNTIYLDSQGFRARGSVSGWNSRACIWMGKQINICDAMSDILMWEKEKTEEGWTGALLCLLKWGSNFGPEWQKGNIWIAKRKYFSSLVAKIMMRVKWIDEY